MTAGTGARALVLYTYLQLLDFLSTIAFRLHGVREGNPVVRFLLERCSSELEGLLAIKLAALALGVTAWVSGRGRLLTRVNVVFALVVAWNLIVMIAARVAQA